MIKVFIKHKILSVETILSAYTHTHIYTQAPVLASILTVQNLLTYYTQLREPVWPNGKALG